MQVGWLFTTANTANTANDDHETKTCERNGAGQPQAKAAPSLATAGASDLAEPAGRTPAVSTARNP